MYVHDEIYHVFYNCQKCMCMMCDLYSDCRMCWICYPLGGTYPTKKCDTFVPYGAPEEIKDLFR